MKIISKECPKCGANLEFKVGEKDVHCKSCRRDFAIEYDHDKEQLGPEDFNLLPAANFIRKFTLVMFVIIFITSFVMLGFGIFAQIQMTKGMTEQINNMDSRYQVRLGN